MLNVTKLVTFRTAMLICFIIFQANKHTYGAVCPTIDLRADFKSFPQILSKMSNCTVVEGYVQLVLLENSVESDYENVTFPKLREITQYLVIYRAVGLKSLSSLFPNLSIIRGTKLVGNAALAIHENNNLRDIGLYRLTHIQEGSVYITKNRELCFGNSIDWERMMRINDTKASYYDVNFIQNKDSSECNQREVCRESGCERDLCWSERHCQLLPTDCHPLCAGGCYKPNDPDECFVCKGFLSENKCVSECPPDRYAYHNRICLTDIDCRNKSRKRPIVIHYFPFNGKCISQCPSMYQMVDNDTCVSCEKVKCYKLCHTDYDDNTFRITTISEAFALESCTYVNASISIEQFSGNYNEDMEAVFEQTLGMIEVIRGQLQVIHSHSIVSLKFLKNLRLIEGKHTMNSTNDTPSSDDFFPETLVVKDNRNLRKLWDWDKRESNFTINGKIKFHFNPKLCISEINKLIEVAGLEGVTDLDVSKTSNGDQTTCNDVPFNVTIEKITKNSVILALHVCLNVTSEFASRFVIFYRKSEGTTKNETMLLKSASECGTDDQWEVSRDAESNANNDTSYVFIPHLDPATEYIYFVRSFYSTVGTSQIMNFTTLPSQPSAPVNLRVNSTGVHSIELVWDPPLHPHGPLSHYMVQGYYQTDQIADVLDRDYCVFKLKDGEVLTSKPSTTSIITPTPSVDSKCNCDVAVSKKSSYKTCDAIDGPSTLAAYKPDFGKEVCDAYFYELVETRSFIEDTVLRIPGHEFSEDDNQIGDSPENVSYQNETGADERFNSFSFKVNANTTSIEIDNLRHFSEYIVFISACPDPQAQIPCSRDAIIPIRTASDPEADQILKSKIFINVYNETANISWEEPTLVNSFVHSYILEYRPNVENAKYGEKCITSKDFRLSNNTYTLPNLPAGEYDLRIRAVSLSNEGLPAVTSFIIEERTAGLGTIIAFVVGLVVVGLIILSIVFYVLRRRLKEKQILFASVNPRYEPVYIEDKWEVPRENLTLIRQLGRGTFGSVHEGILKPDIKCAVKTTTSVGYEDNQQFLMEATTMKEFHDAYHIVKLIGVVSKVTPSYVIMELMEQGDLKSFLLKRGSDLCDDSKTLPEPLLMKMVAQIADGMAYLEARKFVHRDLAARNCMVAADDTVKIGDFGLARDIYEHDYYRRLEKTTLPVRWMCPESLRDGVYTSYGDVWSFGIVLWEITTLAQMPYHPKSNEEVIRYVQGGNILDIPDNAHEILKPIMRNCWRWFPHHRPKFVQILRILEPYLNKEFQKVSYFHNGAGPSAPDGVKPYKNTKDPKDECYIYTDDNDELQLYLGQCPKEPASGRLLSTSNSVRYIPSRENGVIVDDDS